LRNKSGLRREKFLEERGGAGGDVAAKRKVKFPSDFLPAWIEEEMGGMGGVGCEPGKGRFSGGHARADMMMKRRREKFDRGVSGLER